MCLTAELPSTTIDALVHTVNLGGAMKIGFTVLLLSAWPALVPAQETVSYRVIATNKTSTMQKEMQEAGEAGYRFAAVMGGETAFGGKEVVAIMQKPAASAGKFAYRLLATNKTSTMQKEMQEAGDAGYAYVGQTVFESLFGGKEVACIFERAVEASPPSGKFEYKLLATSKTSTMQKELQEAGESAYQVIGMTVGKTMIGGNELVTILRRPVAR
jgi:hypothetical protein